MQTVVRFFVGRVGSRDASGDGGRSAISDSSIAFVRVTFVVATVVGVVAPVGPSVSTDAAATATVAAGANATAAATTAAAAVVVLARRPATRAAR